MKHVRESFCKQNMVKDRLKFSTKRHKERKVFYGRRVVESENKLVNVNTKANSDSSIVNN